MQWDVLSGSAAVRDGTEKVVRLQRLPAAAVTALVYASLTPSGPRPILPGQMTDLLWGDGRDRAGHLSTVWHRLRTANAELAGRLVLDDAGYHLRIDERDWVDLRVYRAIARRARHAAEGETSLGVYLDRHALRLYPQPHLHWLPATVAMDQVRDALAEERLTYVADLAELLISQHRWDEVIPLLKEELRLQPDREALIKPLMRSLYAKDHKSDALTHYQAYRRQMRKRFDTDPTAVLQDLATRISRNDPALDPGDPLPLHSPGDEALLAIRGNADPDTYSIAELYNAAVGGRWALASARATASLLLLTVPQMETPWWGEEYTHRVIGVAVNQHKISQVIVLGAGLPTERYSAHRWAAQHAPGIKVLYTTGFEIVARAFHSMDTNRDLVRIIHDDVNHAQRIMTHPDFTGFIDLSQPTVIVVIDDINYVPDPAGVMAPWIEAAAPGSIFATLGVTSVGMSDRVKRVLEMIYNSTPTPGLLLRTEETLIKAMKGLDIIAGVESVEQIWNHLPGPPGEFPTLGCVGIKR